MEIYAELGTAIGSLLDVHRLRTRTARSTDMMQKTRFLQSHDSLVRPSELTQDDDGRWVIAFENQACWDWRVEQASDDTPVLSACADDDLAQLRVLTPSLNEFLQGFLLREAVFGSRFRASVDSFDAVANLDPIKLGCRVVNATSDFYFSALGEVLINHEAGIWWFGSNSSDPWLTLGLGPKSA